MSDHRPVHHKGNLISVAISGAATSHTRKGLKKHFQNTNGFDSSHHRKLSHKQTTLEFQGPQSLVPLSTLAAEGKLEELKSSIDTYNLTLKETDQNGCTLLHHAAAHNQITVMQDLIEREIALNDTDNDGNTALHLASSEECVEACHLLLTRGASDTILNKELNSPLHIAAQGRNQSLAALLEHPVDYLVLGYRRRMPLHVMAEVDNIDGVELFQEKILSGKDKTKIFRLCARDEDGLTPMHLAARMNSHRVLDFFIRSCVKHSYDVDSVLGFIDEENSTPLHAAVDSGHFEVAEVLLRHGASPTASKGDLIPPVHMACTQGRSRILKAMIEFAGHKILNHTDQHQRTPLHYCALSIRSSLLIPQVIECAKIAVSIDAQDNKGRTSLHNAITSANLIGMKDLLSYGANPLIKDKHGFNALHLAMYRNRKVIVDVLLKTPQAAELSTSKSQTGYCPLHLALRLGHDELIPGLISAVQFEVKNSKDDKGNNYLHLAAKRGNYKALKSLLDVPVIQKGLNEPNNLGATPLHSAAFGDHYRCLELLLNNGAMFHKCFSGETAFHMACRKGFTDCAKLLLNAFSGQLHLSDKNGNSALHATAQSKVPSVVALVLDKGCKLTFNLDSKSFFDIIIDGADVNSAMAVIQHDRWQECLDFHSPSQQSPMIGLIQKMPKVAQVVLDQCHSKAEIVCKTHRDYWEHFDFKYLLTYERMIEQNLAITNQHSDPHGHPKVQRHDSTFLPSFDDLDLTTVHYKGSTNRQSATSIEKGERRSSNYPVKTMEALENMVAYKRANLLTHPLIDAFLSSKWKAYGRFIFSALYLLKFLLVLLLSVFVMIIPNPIQMYNNGYHIGLVNQTDFNDSNSVDPNSLRISSGAQLVRAFTLLLNSLFLLASMFFLVHACLQSRVIKFVLNISTWINFSTLLFNFIFLVAPNTLEVWPIGAVACFFSWLSLLFGLQYFTVAGTIVKMIVAVSKSVILVLLICIFMLLAFAFSFYILAGSLSEFSNVGYSFLSVFGFMLGELPYVTYVKEDLSGNLIYGKFFLIFMVVLAVLMSIVIANLLIGLAIGDIERIKVNAILDKKGSEIEFLGQIVQVVPNRLLQRLLQTTHTHYPNAKKSFLHWLKQDSLDWIKDILVTETEPIHSSSPISRANDTKEISELKMHILDLKETIQQFQDSMLLNRKREALVGRQSAVSLNSFEMDFIEDFKQEIDPSATDSQEY